MSKQIEVVQRYFQAIQERNSAVVATTLAPSYLEHDPGVGDGLSGVAAYIRQLQPHEHQSLVRRLRTLRLSLRKAMVRSQPSTRSLMSFALRES